MEKLATDNVTDNEHHNAGMSQPFLYLIEMVPTCTVYFLLAIH